MRGIAFVTTALVACGSDTNFPKDKEETVTVTNTVTNTVTVTVEDTGMETMPPEGCIFNFRAYTEDDHYVDLTLGSMPEVSLLSEEDVLAPHGTVPESAVIKVRSLKQCPNLSLLGVEAVIERVDGESFPFTRGDGPTNTLRQTEPASSWESDTFWSGDQEDEGTAYGLWAAWDASGPGPKSGIFEAVMVDGPLYYQLDLPVIGELPIGEYQITYTVHWLDQVSGTEIWYANLDQDNVEYVTIQ